MQYVVKYKLFFQTFNKEIEDTIEVDNGLSYFNGEKNLSNSSSAPRSEDLQRTDNIDLGRLWAGQWNGLRLPAAG